VAVTCSIKVEAQVSATKNFVLTRTYKQKTKDVNTGDTKTASINVVYLDGFGRPTQANGIQMNPGGKDIVRYVEYDNMGRTPTGFLPFINLTAGANGTFLSTAKALQASFYSTANSDNNTVKDPKPWSNTTFETNPFGRSVEIRTAGQNYENFPTLIDYKFSKQGNATPNGLTGIVDESDIQRYSYYGNYDPTDYSNLRKIKLEGKYGSNMMTVVEVTQKDKDANGNEINRKVKQYRDFEGRNILTRTWDGAKWLETYYVYDELNQVRAVLSPKLTSQYKSTTAVIDFATGADLTNLNELAHLYMYDEIGRLIIKKETGIEEKQYIYDSYDRLVFSQDANQRTRGVWGYADYDALNRVVVTGEAVLTANLNVSVSAGLRNRTSYQIATNSFSRYTTKSGSGYAAINTTTSGLTATKTELTKVFYDDYSFTLPTGATAPSGALANPRGFVTGTHVKVLGEDTWLKEVTYYDNDYHAIKTYQDLYGLPAAASGGQVVEVSTNNYNSLFHGQIASQVTEHTNLMNNATPIITKKFCYDHEERLKTIIYKISDGPNDKEAKEVIGAAYVYNDLGQVVLKSMHQTATMKDPAFYVGYSHHLHGMIKSISNRLFEQQIYYDTRKDGSLGYLNGNVSELFHRFDDKTDSDLRGQKFAYDLLNRLTGNSNTTNSGDGYKPWNNKETMSYDPNGNILTLQRSKDGFGQIDDLGYTYRNSGNVVSSITDMSNNPQGFRTRTSNAYTFDANGNLLTDGNKGINSNILYNYLNLPTQITIPDANGVGKTLNYTYDATGQKLAMLVSGTTDRTLYTGEIEYNNQALVTRIHTPMGYASRDADGLWQYTYNLKDYQGNVRVTAKYDPDTKLAVTTQKTDFFALGAPIRYDSENFNRYLYQDKEQQPYSEFFDFGWRQYDPLVGRWFNNDPADQFASISPYAYVRNNPLMYGDPDGAFSLQGLWNGVKDLVNCTIIPYLQNPNNLQTIAGATGGFGGFSTLNAINQNNHGEIITSPLNNGPGRGNISVPSSTTQQLKPQGIKPQSINYVPKDPLLLKDIKIPPLFKWVTGVSTFVAAMAMPANGNHPVSPDGTPAGMIPSPSIRMNLTDDEYTEFYEIVRAISKGKVLLPQDMERYNELFEKAHRDKSLLPKNPKAGNGDKKKLHHIASNKHTSVYTPQFEAIAKKYGLNLDDDWNKIYISDEYHYSKHPSDYHNFVLRGMQRAASEAGNNKDLFLQLYDLYVIQPLLSEPGRLNTWDWKFLFWLSGNEY
jgi:RHS repeat-associated protein